MLRAMQGVGVALARWTLVQSSIEAGRLVALTRKRKKADFAPIWFSSSAA
jgi:LysR family glycine cleavage system transcriptional activator